MHKSDIYNRIHDLPTAQLEQNARVWGFLAAQRDYSPRYSKLHYAATIEVMTRKGKPMTKSEAGRLGGLKTAAQHGAEYMAAIGKRGAIAMHKKYKMVPYGQDDFILIDRETGNPNRKTLNGKEITE